MHWRMSNGWNESADAWISDQGERGDFARAFVLDKVMLQRIEAQRFGNAFAGQVVFRGAETATDDHNIGAKECVLGGGNQVAEVVADDALEDHIDPKQVKLLGEVKRVAVEAVRGEHLGAHRDDFGVHALRV